MNNAVLNLPDALAWDRMSTPIGPVLLVTDHAGVLRALDFEDDESRMRRLLRIQYGSMEPARRAAPADTRAALRGYFAGDLDALSRIHWTAVGTGFQRSVWNALTTIKPGTTTSYGALARKLGSPRASRAVGLANGSNPVSIVVPCHRVVGAKGALTGYGGGLHRKRWLLAHEGVRFE